MKKTLGLDLGTNSLGWAILDDVSGDILDKGVLVFPEGMKVTETDATKTLAANRRTARMGRRLRFRRKMRKWQLLGLLSKHQMCPLSLEELGAWKQKGIYPTHNAAFLNWLKATDTSNPYCDRNAAVEGKVPPFVLGRALYHICQRRGFKSSRKEENAQFDEAGKRKKDADKTLGKVKSGVTQLDKEIAASGAKTLGQYFFRLMAGEKGLLAKTRVRGRYTGRKEQYEVEFNAIMDVQGFAPNDALRQKLHEAIFYQRPLRSQKHLVGKCPLETHNPRVQIGHPAFEEYRLLCFVNNLTLEDEQGQIRDDDGNLLYPLTLHDKQRIVAEATRILKPTFNHLYTIFKDDPRFKEKGVRFHYYDKNDVIPSCPVRQRIKAAFGAIVYNEQLVFDALTFYDDPALLAGWFKRHYPDLDDAAVAALSRISPPDGNAQYSLKAITRILPFLRKGLGFSDALLCAKLPEVVADYAAHEEEILLHLNECHFTYHQDKAAYAALPRVIREKTAKPVPFLDRFKAYLAGLGVDEEGWQRLYLHDGKVYVPETTYYPHGKHHPSDAITLKQPRLPKVELGMIRNPLVQRAMTTLRRLVNCLADQGKIDTDDTIRIELARTVNDFSTRQAWQRWQDKCRAKRDEARQKIVELHVAPTEDAIDRMVLWQEQGKKCLYSGETIDQDKVLTGNFFDIEHTIPRSLSGDDSLANKTICEKEYNETVKRGNIPQDCPNWEQINVNLRPWREKLAELEKQYGNERRDVKGKTDAKQRADARVKALTTRFEVNYWRDKLRRFDVTRKELKGPDGGLNGFKKRQLVDTGIMCTHAVDLLKCLYPQTYAVNGTATAFARKAWGIQPDSAKDRSEHTHHAKDAMVIAALTPGRFNAICAALKDDGITHPRPCDVCPLPYPNFAEKVRQASSEILVKHVLRQTTLRPSSKRNALAKAHHEKGDPNAPIVKYVLSKGDTVRGQLHNDTFYGCIQDPTQGKKVFVERKSLVGSLSDALGIVKKIVDPTIRRLVKEQLTALKEKGVKAVEPGDIRMPSGVPINKVRIVAQTKNPACLRTHAFASEKDYKNPYYVVSAKDSNFRMAIFEKDGKFFVQTDNSLTWAQNHKKPDYVPFDRQIGFVGYVMPGTMALTYAEGHPEEVQHLSTKELTKRLYKVVKFKADGRMTLRHHVEARASGVLSADLKAMGKNVEGESQIALDVPHELLLVSPSVYMKQMLFEGIHFRMNLDGTITFLR